MYNGHLYLLNQKDGSLILDKKVYTVNIKGVTYGHVCSPTIIKTDSGYNVFTAYDDGRGMSSDTFGIAHYILDSEMNVTDDSKQNCFGTVGGSLTQYTNDSFTGVYFASGNGIYCMDTYGKYTLINDIISSTNRAKAPITLVNGEYLFISTYNTERPIFQLKIDGTTVGTYSVPDNVDSYCMSPVTVVDGYILSGTDIGAYAMTGAFDAYVTPSGSDAIEPTVILCWIAAGLTTATAVLYSIFRFGLKWKHPAQHISDSIRTFIYGEEYSHNTLNKHRLFITLCVGFTLTAVMALMSLCVGSELTMSLPDMVNSLSSAIGKHGHSLTYSEMVLYNSRLPRVLAALGVGIGLSVAGAVYQALIRNPLVDPYIMGVSSGAGTVAVAVIAFDFTFFGLFQSGSIYLLALGAILGGMIAYGCTMLLAKKSGGSSINYVLSGIIVGLVFSAVQTLLMIFAGNDVSGALTWLYGSFSTMNWNELWLTLIPAVTLSFIPLIWARDLNLILLGEDQAKQMGLNTKRFEIILFTTASVITAFCVAFVGIIGFVGLVIPHLCRMILGGDHRLVIPASMAFGGFLMITADLASRILVTGYNLPVGAITTFIGIPVFAYLLVKKGRMYDI